LEEGVANVAAGLDPTQIEANAIALAGQIKNIQFSDSELQAARAGVPSALAAVTASVEALSGGTNTVNTALERLETGLANFATALENGDLSASRIQLDSQIIGEQVRDGIIAGFLNAFNVDDVTNSGLGRLMEGMMSATAPDGAFTGFINAMIQGTTLLSGAQFVGGIAGIGNNDAVDHIINALGPAAMALFSGGAGLFNRARSTTGGADGMATARTSIRDQMNPNSPSFMGAENFSRLTSGLAGAGLGAAAMAATVDSGSLATALRAAFTENEPMPVRIVSSAVPFGSSTN
jgi:hypothetical protein